MRSLVVVLHFVVLLFARARECAKRAQSFLQLARTPGFPLSWWTLADVWDIKNFGPKPRNPETGEEYQTELELWIAQKQIETHIAAAAMPAPKPLSILYLYNLLIYLNLFRRFISFYL
jgi:hypothetical protein